jgi:SAM-dependent methyltransferase
VKPQRLVFGEVAATYDDVRAGYPAQIIDTIFRYAGGPCPVVEAGAGTGKATALFVAAGVPVTCIEPDPAMAAVLSARFGGQVALFAGGFEDWVPPAGGVPLICAALAFHWVDPQRRWQLAHDGLAPAGVLALFGHSYGFADPDLERRLDAEYHRHAPQLYGAGLHGAAPSPREYWFHREMTGSGRFDDVTSVLLQSTVDYPTDRYRRLLSTFSDHRMVPADTRERLHDALGAVIDRSGGVVTVRLDTILTMGRTALRL